MLTQCFQIMQRLMTLPYNNVDRTRGSAVVSVSLDEEEGKCIFYCCDCLEMIDFAFFVDSGEETWYVTSHSRLTHSTKSQKS